MKQQINRLLDVLWAKRRTAMLCSAVFAALAACAYIALGAHLPAAKEAYAYASNERAYTNVIAEKEARDKAAFEICPLKLKAPVKPGARGEAVKYIRVRLTRLGYPSGEGELFDGALEAAVIAFQTDCGLKADGVVGSETLAALES